MQLSSYKVFFFFFNFVLFLGNLCLHFANLVFNVVFHLVASQLITLTSFLLFVFAFFCEWCSATFFVVVVIFFLFASSECFTSFCLIDKPLLCEDKYKQNKFDECYARIRQTLNLHTSHKVKRFSKLISHFVLPNRWSLCVRAHTWD